MTAECLISTAFINMKSLAKGGNKELGTRFDF